MVTKQYEMRRYQSGEWKPVTSNEINTITVGIKEIPGQGRFPRADVETYIRSDKSPQYDPFLEFFSGLDPWDGRDRILELANCIEQTHEKDGPLKELYFRKWIPAMAAQCTLIGQNQGCLVLAGRKGGRYKTTFLEKIGESVAGKDYVHAGMFDPKNRDDRIRTAGTALIVLDELDKLERGGLDALCYTMTSKTWRERRPFGTSDETTVRRCSFSGTVNEHAGLMRNPDSNRRWFVIQTERALMDRLAKIDMRQLWAQALRVAKTEKYWLDETENEMVTEANLRYYIPDDEESIVKVHYASCSQAGAIMQREYLTSIELVDRHSSAAIKLSTHRMAKALSRNGFRQVAGRRWEVYHRLKEATTNGEEY